ncbi:MAG: ferrochelatase [Gammaproteobacteria bacterium]|nr:ferrochelatase [Gammaproteobacteria bacterium]
MNKAGVLLINLGTPNNADPKSVRNYLKEFLNDPRVIDLPCVTRWVLTNLIIIPFRYKKTTEAYQKIWAESGSPLLSNSLKLKTALSHELGSAYQIELGMRYGNPSIQSALDKLKNCEKIIVIPLFPQYSSAATGSAIENVMHYLSKQWNIPTLHIIKDFYDNPGFIAAYTQLISETTTKKNIEHFVFSYHGLPERHITKSNCTASCDHVNACPKIDVTNAYCYRAQCYRTSELLALSLGLKPTQYTVCFQSRLGRTPWIQPYTDVVLPKLREQGIKNIAVVCPSFVSDCLETLEEINMRARADWAALGGSEFVFVPCVNDHTLWVKALSNLIVSIM